MLSAWKAAVAGLGFGNRCRRAAISSALEGDDFIRCRREWSGETNDGSECQRDSDPRLYGRLLGGRVLELLQRTHLDLDSGRLGSEPLLLLGERIDTLALRLGRNAGHGDLEQAGQDKGACPVLVDGTDDSALQASQHGANILGHDLGCGRDVIDQPRLAKDVLDRLVCSRLRSGFRRRFLSNFLGSHDYSYIDI